MTALITVVKRYGSNLRSESYLTRTKLKLRSHVQESYCRVTLEQGAKVPHSAMDELVHPVVYPAFVRMQVGQPEMTIVNIYHFNNYNNLWLIYYCFI